MSLSLSYPCDILFYNSAFQGLQRQHSAIHVLQAVESYFCLLGLSCTVNATSFTVDVRLIILMLCLEEVKMEGMILGGAKLLLSYLENKEIMGGMNIVERIFHQNLAF